MINKIYITGSVGSGKSTLAKQLSKEFGFVHCELDNVIYELDAESKTGNRKRSPADRDALINEVLSNERWIVEDTVRADYEYIWQMSDSIILLEPPVYVIKRRVICRWVKQNLGLEKSGYKPGFYMLKYMFKWIKDYENGTTGPKSRINNYSHKLSVLKTDADIKSYKKDRLVK